MTLAPRHVIIAAVALAVAAIAILTRPVATTASATTPRATLQINAVVRDFKAYENGQGHPDFQRWSGKVRLGLVEPFLGPDGKPVLRDKAGIELQDPFTDAAGRPVNPFQEAISELSPGDDDDDVDSIYDEDGILEAEEHFQGSARGRLQRPNDDRVTSSDSFAQWYRDVPGVNVSVMLPLILEETAPGSGRFVFDSHAAATRQLNPWMEGLPINGFFPINGRGFGNYPHHHNGSTNFHFTTEVITTFTYREGAGYTFGFRGDDDLWVFIGGRLVIDLGGVHAAEEQWVDLDTLDWLEDGEEYSMHIFHAERRTVRSDFRIETTIPMRPLGSVNTFDAFD